MAPSKVHELLKTARAGCCKVCAEPEDKCKRFLICGHSLCRYKYYHIRCMNTDQISSNKQEGNPCWYCPSCLCRSCFRDKDDNKIILCDGCDGAYHLYCLRPRRTTVPKGEWYCKSCTKAKAQEEEVRQYEKRMLKLHRKRNVAMLKSDKYVGFELLLSGAAKLKADEEAERREEKETVAAIEMLQGDEEMDTDAE